MKMIGKWNEKLGIVDESKMSWVELMRHGMGLGKQMSDLDDDTDDDDK